MLKSAMVIYKSTHSGAHTINYLYKLLHISIPPPPPPLHLHLNTLIHRVLPYKMESINFTMVVLMSKQPALCYDKIYQFQKSNSHLLTCGHEKFFLLLKAKTCSSRDVPLESLLPVDWVSVLCLNNIIAFEIITWSCDLKLIYQLKFLHQIRYVI